MKNSKLKLSRTQRFVLWGALLLGGVGFVTGVGLCLHYKLPIPPLFITELGLMLGGCLGYLLSKVEFESPDRASHHGEGWKVV